MTRDYWRIALVCVVSGAGLAVNVIVSDVLPKPHRSLGIELLKVIGYAGMYGVPAYIVLASAAFIRNRSHPVYPRGHCTTCGYNLRGSPGGICPECGTPFEGHRTKPAIRGASD